MQRYEVEAIFEQKKDGLFEDINISSQKPIAIDVYKRQVLVYIHVLHI